MVYGSVADKDVDAALRLIPAGTKCVFTKAQGKRALSSQEIYDRYMAVRVEKGRLAEVAYCTADVDEAVRTALSVAGSLKDTDPKARPLIYIGGSTYVVSEALVSLK